MKTILVVCSLLVLTSCGSSGGRNSSSSAKGDQAPAWVMKPPKSDQYLYGVGQADLNDRESAKDQARRDLSAQIQISINAVRSEQVLINVGKTQNSLAERLDKKIDDQVRTEVQLTDLPGIQVAEQVDAKNTTYVLVKMDRDAWARSIRMEVAELDLKIESAYNTVKQHMASGLSELQQVMRLYKELVPLFSKREILEERYRLASPQGTLPVCPVDAVMIRTTLSTLLLGITVSLPSDPSVAAFLPGLTEACANRGLQVLDNPANAALNLDFKVAEVKRVIEGSIKLEGTASGSVKDRASGRLLGALEARATAGSGSEDAARRQLLQKLGQQIAVELEEQLFTYLTRL